ncbi:MULTISPECIES: thioredoxin family protein [Undibacterium]|uniref:Thioredoxin family protein n=2 Tax=Undibacterium umbellatum TaxID=2762300 RepID=A0ABR6ZFW2_9BURK|nr:MULTISPECIES: thioredoxin family protein [Undibacterium]MBC3910261.1 thioredoxin family protein [Undibacterium umbellatum]MDP1978435.1 thioredoxin family protein [Undibacterium sp.]
MKKLLSLIFTLSLAWLINPASAAPPQAYDETADAKAAVSQALAEARKVDKKVLVIFGANWCKDCLELDKSMHGKNEALLASKFITVKVNVGQFDKNKELVDLYGNPTKKGIPAAVLLRPDNSVLYASKGGELSNARKMSEQGVYDFFDEITALYR